MAVRVANEDWGQVNITDPTPLDTPNQENDAVRLRYYPGGMVFFPRLHCLARLPLAMDMVRKV
jgi:hypothetical protein